MSEDRRVLDAYRAASGLLDERPRAGTREAILAAAARAVRARPTAPGARLAPRARIRPARKPLALAASVLVGAIALTVATRTDDPPPSVPARELAAAEPAEPDAPAPLATAPAAAPPAPPSPPVASGRAREETPRPAAKAPAAHLEARDAAPDGASPPSAAVLAVRGAAAPPAADRPQSDAPPSRSSERVIARPVQRTAPIDGAPEDDPSRWLQHIVALRAAGRDDEADAQLKRLREHYPALEVPPAALRAGAR